MPVILSTSPGSVVAIAAPAEQAAFQPLVAVEYNQLSFQQSQSLITRVMISNQTNHQFLHTLGDDIFIYVFGDRIGEMVLSGLALSTCPGVGGPHGVENLMEYFNENKLSNRDTPMNIAIGRSTTVQAYMTDFQADTSDFHSLVMQYRLGFSLLPQTAYPSGD